MARNCFDRYVWMIDTISRYGHISRGELSRLWERSTLNDTGEGLKERTFHNHREAILDTFGIEIKCDRSLGYYIANGDDLGSDGIRRWLLESLSMNNLLNESADMRDRIIFEKIPSGRRWLPVIVSAMRDGKAVEVTYQRFSRDEPNTFTAHPYCLKLFRQRWYMLAKSEEKQEARIYALDERMKDVRPSVRKLAVPKKFDAASFFADYFGIIVGTDRKPAEIRIKVAADQVKYFTSLPVHDSQRIVEEESGPGFTVFSFRLAPTYDFKQEILSRGPGVEVLSPQDFREEVMSDIAAMAANYGL